MNLGDGACDFAWKNLTGERIGLGFLIGEVLIRNSYNVTGLFVASSLIPFRYVSWGTAASDDISSSVGASVDIGSGVAKSVGGCGVGEVD